VVAVIVPAKQVQRLRPSDRSRDLGLCYGRSKHGIGAPSRRQRGDQPVDRFNDRGTVGRRQRIIA
jgi:hypothetical protein